MTTLNSLHERLDTLDIERQELLNQIKHLEDLKANSDVYNQVIEPLSFPGLIFDTPSEDKGSLIHQVLPFKFYPSYPSMPVDQRFHRGILFLENGKIRSMELEFSIDEMTIVLPEGSGDSGSRSIDSGSISAYVNPDFELGDANGFEAQLRHIYENVTITMKTANYYRDEDRT